MKILFLFLFLSCSLVRADFLSKGNIPSISDADASLEMARLYKEDEQYQKAIVQYRKVIELEPDNYDGRLELALALAGQGDIEEARALLAEVKLNHKGLLALASIAETGKDFPEAERLYRSVLREQNNSLLRFRLASVLHWQKKYKEAAEMFKVLVDEYPGDIQLRRYYARSLGEAGYKQEALEIWQGTFPSS